MSSPEFRVEELDQIVVGGFVDVVERGEFSLEEGQNLRLFFHVGGRKAVEPVILVDQVGIHPYGEHLESFSGIEVTDPESENAWIPGKRISAIWNHNLGFMIFLTAVDDIAVPQAEEFYNSQIDRSGQ